MTGSFRSSISSAGAPTYSRSGCESRDLGEPAAVEHLVEEVHSRLPPPQVAEAGGMSFETSC
jgi:hypothetical protein